MTVRYYTLVSSLPRLVHFEQAEVNPITRKQLDRRLHMLESTHANQLHQAESLLEWQQHPLTRTDEQIALQYRQTRKQITHPCLRQFIDFRLERRTILAALRRRQQGVASPGSSFGMGNYSQWLNNHWDEPDFGLPHAHPWIKKAKDYIETEQALALQRFLMDLTWQRLSRIAQTDLFGFNAVFAFVFKWDILNRWLSYEPEAAKERFQILMQETMGGYEPNFS